MDPNDFSTLPNLGRSLVQNFAPMPVTISIYGAHVLLFSVFIIKSKHRPWKTIVAAILGFLLATGDCIAGIVDFITLIRLHLIEYVQLPIDVQFALGVKRQFTSAIIAQWCSDFMPILSDTIVIWRCWHLFSGQRWVMVLPIICLLSSTALLLTFLVFVSTPSGYTSTFGATGQNQQNTRLYNAGIILSLATNVVSTLLYGYKLWLYRRDILGLERRRSHGEKILFLLVESGAAYCCLQFVYVLLNTVPRITVPAASLVVSNVFSAAYLSISGVYPLIVLIVAHTHVRTDVWVSNNSGLSGNLEVDSHFCPPTIEQMAFALPLTQSATVKSEEDGGQRKDHARPIGDKDVV